MALATTFTPNSTTSNAFPVPYEEYSASGAISAGAGVAVLTGNSALTMTLANPDGMLDGGRLLIISTGTGAHTVTNTTGFNNGSTASDVATWTGAAGNCMEVVAINGVWYTVSLRNVALG